MKSLVRLFIAGCAIAATFLIAQPAFAVTYCSATTYTDFVGFVGTALTVHDSYRVQGPDNNWYKTWHPATNSQAPGNQHESGCVFGHEHGNDPTDTAKQTANNTKPPFGYIAATAGMSEAHEGYKVQSILHGQCDADNHDSVFPADIRAVIHTGSAALGRFNTTLHSMELSYKGFNIVGTTCGSPPGAASTLNKSGLTFTVQAMSDTGTSANNGTVCDLPRMPGKTFPGINETNPPQNYSGNCVISGHPENAYEIWGMVIDICPNPNGPYTINGFCGPNNSPLYVEWDPAVKDPITTLNFANYAQTNYTQTIVNPTGPSATGPDSSFLGCDRETTQGTKYWNNPTVGGGNTTWYTKTDATDAQPTSDGTHPFKQLVSLSVATDLTGFYDRDDHENFCGTYGIETPN